MEINTAAAPSEIAAAAEKTFTPVEAEWCLGCAYCFQCHCNSGAKVGDCFLCENCDAILCVRFDSENERRLEQIVLKTPADGAALIRAHGWEIWRAVIWRSVLRPFQVVWNRLALRLGQYAVFRRTLLRGRHWERGELCVAELDPSQANYFRSVGQPGRKDDTCDIWIPTQFCHHGEEDVLQCEGSPRPTHPHRPQLSRP